MSVLRALAAATAVFVAGSASAQASNENHAAFESYLVQLGKGAVPMEEAPVRLGARFIALDGGSKDDPYGAFAQAARGCSLSRYDRVAHAGDASFFTAALACPAGGRLMLTVEMSRGQITNLAWGTRDTVFAPPAPPAPPKVSN